MVHIIYNQPSIKAADQADLCPEKETHSQRIKQTNDKIHFENIYWNFKRKIERLKAYWIYWRQRNYFCQNYYYFFRYHWSWDGCDI